MRRPCCLIAMLISCNVCVVAKSSAKCTEVGVCLQKVVPVSWCCMTLRCFRNMPSGIPSQGWKPRTAKPSVPYRKIFRPKKFRLIIDLLGSICPNTTLLSPPDENASGLTKVRSMCFLRIQGIRMEGDFDNMAGWWQTAWDI